MSRLSGALGAAMILGLPLAAEAADYQITLTDGVIAPQTLEVKAGEEIVLTVSNAGKTPAEFESKPLHIEKVIAPGSSATFTLTGLAAGRYKFVEEFHENQPTGRGVIEVK